MKKKNDRSCFLFPDIILNALEDRKRLFPFSVVEVKRDLEIKPLEAQEWQTIAYMVALAETYQTQVMYGTINESYRIFELERTKKGFWLAKSEMEPCNLLVRGRSHWKLYRYWTCLNIQFLDREPRLILLDISPSGPNLDRNIFPKFGQNNLSKI